LKTITIFTPFTINRLLQDLVFASYEADGRWPNSTFY